MRATDVLRLGFDTIAPGGLADLVARGAQIIMELARAANERGTVPIAVHRDLVTTRHDLRGDLGRLIDHPPEEEERGMAVEGGKAVEDGRGRRRIGSVVEGERDVPCSPQPDQPRAEARAERSEQRQGRRAVGGGEGDCGSARDRREARHAVSSIVEICRAALASFTRAMVLIALIVGSPLTSITYR